LKTIAGPMLLTK